MDPMTIALLSAGGSAVSSIVGGLLSKNPKESKTQKQKRKLVDDLLASLNGNGSFNDMFNMDEGAFQKSFVDPAKARFKNQIAPQIQQEYIQSGQHRGTGLDDTLSRAGVDMDQLLNEQYMNFQQGALNRKQQAIQTILGGQEGVQPGQNFGEKLQSGAAGYFTGSDFGESMDDILNAFSKKSQNKSTMGSAMGSASVREGYSR